MICCLFFRFLKNNTGSKIPPTYPKFKTLKRKERKIRVDYPFPPPQNSSRVEKKILLELRELTCYLSPQGFFV
jgi:hypothetical protein